MTKIYTMRRRSKRKPRMRLNRLKRSAPAENLSGWVNGMEASDIEERFSKALRRIRKDFNFRVNFRTAVSVPGEDKEIDFLVDRGGQFQAVEVDGEIGHKTSSQQGKDQLREILLNEALERQNILPIMRVPWWQLDTQDKANDFVLRTFI